MPQRPLPADLCRANRQPRAARIAERVDDGAAGSPRGSVSGLSPLWARRRLTRHAQSVPSGSQRSAAASAAHGGRGSEPALERL